MQQIIPKEAKETSSTRVNALTLFSNNDFILFSYLRTLDIWRT